MSTYADIYIIPEEYKNLDSFEGDYVEYEDEDIVHTLYGFDCTNIITNLLSLEPSKEVHLITLQNFLTAKKTYFTNYNESLLLEQFAINEEDYKLTHERLIEFFKDVEPVIKTEKKLFLWVSW